jgi:hypothetical protein
LKVGQGHPKVNQVRSMCHKIFLPNYIEIRPVVFSVSRSQAIYADGFKNVQPTHYMCELIIIIMTMCGFWCEGVDVRIAGVGHNPTTLRVRALHALSYMQIPLFHVQRFRSHVVSLFHTFIRLSPGWLVCLAITRY